MQDRGQKGIWLGKRCTADEHIIGATDGSVVRSVNVKAQPDEPWSREMFDTMKGFGEAPCPDLLCFVSALQGELVDLVNTVDGCFESVVGSGSM